MKHGEEEVSSMLKEMSLMNEIGTMSVADMLLEDAHSGKQESTPTEINSVNPIFEQPEFQGSIANPRRTEEEEGKRSIGMNLKSLVSTVAGIPGSTQSFMEDLIALPTGKTAAEHKEQLRQYGLEPGGRFPNTQEINEAIEKKIPSLKPENEKEMKEQEGREFFYSLLGPGAGRSIANKAIRAGIGTFSAMQIADQLKQMGYGETAQSLAKMLTGFLSQVGRTGGLNPQDLTREQRIVHEAARRAGLTEAEMTPLLQEEQAARRLGAHTVETEANRAALEGAERGTNRFLDQIETRGRAVPIPENEVNYLRQSTENLRDQIQRGYGREPRAQNVVNYLNSIINDLQAGPHDAQRLIRTYRDINRVFRENRPDQMNLLQAINRRISRVITRINPELGRDFRLGNRLHGSRLDFIRNVGWRNLERSWTHGSPAQNLLTTMATGLAGSLIGHPAAGAIVGAGFSYGRDWVSNQLLTNPRWQGLLRSTTNALREDSPKLAYVTAKEIQQRVKKENPEAYKEIEWPK